ncbi:UNVERIFIED_CONTAM: hypothetical protein H355_003490 [Colinus virginianus]|nr:hypothetical protein H355_003490 [Colinus virginianus]
MAYKSKPDHKVAPLERGNSYYDDMVTGLSYVFVVRGEQNSYLLSPVCFTTENLSANRVHVLTTTELHISYLRSMALSIREADAKRLLWTSLGTSQEQQELPCASAASRESGHACADKANAPPEQQSNLLLNGKPPSQTPRGSGVECSARGSQQSMRSSGEVILRGVCVAISGSTDIEGLPRTHPWLLTSRLVLKPDVLLKRRGKSNLVKLNLDWTGVQAELKKLLGKEVEFERLRGTLTHFIVEPFFPHDEDNNEYYVALRTLRTGDEVLFSHRGGVNVGNVEDHAKRVIIPVLKPQAPGAAVAPMAASQTLPATSHRTAVQDGEGGVPDLAAGPQTAAVEDATNDRVRSASGESQSHVHSGCCWFRTTYSDNDLVDIFQRADLFRDVADPEAKELLPRFLVELYRRFAGMHFAFLEINPFSFDSFNKTFRVLDCAAKLDHTAEFICDKLWGPITFPSPFGRKFTQAEQYIRELDSKTGASLKLTVLNPRGRIWMLIAGGGASVVYADTVCDLGMGHELANYGEYSGAPSEVTTCEYTKTILGLMTAPGTYRQEGKILLIGGGIANFTNVADTFKGIIRALRDYREPLREFKVRVYVRRGGPNYQEGLKRMREIGEELNIKVKVFGPETYITSIIPFSLNDDDGGGDCEKACMQQRQINVEQNPQTVLGSGRGGGKPETVDDFSRVHGWDLGPVSTAAEKMLLGGGDGCSSKNFVGGHHADGAHVVPYCGRLNTWQETTMEEVEKNPLFEKYIQNFLATRSGGSCSPPGVGSESAAAATARTGNSAKTLQEGSAGTASSRGYCAGDGTGEPGLGFAASQLLASGRRDLFTKNTRCFVWGLQTRAVQEMLDFDHACGRKLPSVAAIVYEFSVSHCRPFYFGTEEVFLPVCETLSEAVEQHRDVEVLINFASMRSAVGVTRAALQQATQLRTVVVIAEGVPERLARELAAEVKLRNVCLIGPATVGGIKSGAFRIGNTGGTLENVMNARLYRPGSVGVVTKSGGMLNEMNNILSIVSNGTYEAIAIGGDRFPGTTMLDHLLRFEQNPDIKMLVLLGEVGGDLEYGVTEALRDGRITKPVVAWCVGVCASLFPTEVSFGHAGAWAGSSAEHAAAKNAALREAGAFVPKSFQEFGKAIRQVYVQLVKQGVIVPQREEQVPRIPVDYAWAKKLGLVRKPKGFISTISDDRGEELVYAGWPISKVLGDELGVGGVISLLWFKRPLPRYCYKYLERVLLLTADHGPAVCGAHNVIVTARAGKDLISSLISGLCTIGDRFGGACDQAAQQFLEAFSSGMTPGEFVTDMKRKNKLIMGIGHRVKSVHNPDMRVQLLKRFCKENFPQVPLTSFAEEVEKVTTKKKDTLILNVDGLIGVSMCDMLFYCGSFTENEAKDYIKNGCINGLFVLGRSIGFIGHFLDQKRLKQGLYRHDVDDIAYVLPDWSKRPQN